MKSLVLISKLHLIFLLNMLQLIDGHSTKNTNISYLRSNIGIVSQEPVLFAGSVYDNIVYGDQSRQVPPHEVERAAKLANMHEFIMALKDVSKTLVWWLILTI